MHQGDIDDGSSGEEKEIGRHSSSCPEEENQDIDVLMTAAPHGMHANLRRHPEVLVGVMLP